jgi:bifunctional non-homologous end joining protein LigD
MRYEWLVGVGADELWIPPMLAQSTKIMPTGDDWVYERKLDGLRCVCLRDGDDVRLYSRNHLSFNARFPSIVEALRDLPVDRFVLDGELVAFNEVGGSDFGLLQRSRKDVSVQLHLFDVLHLLGNDARSHTLLERKALLYKFVEPQGPLQLVLHTMGQSDVLLDRACEAGWEGLIAKKAHGTYRSGRSSEWLKLKCSASQELVIGGWTEPKGARIGFGALLMGYYEGGDFRYAGKVGTGFDGELLVSLHRSLLTMERQTSPFVDNPRERNVHWVTPKLVANIAFSEWTRDGRLRHPRFQGLRPDKIAKQVVRES